MDLVHHTYGMGGVVILPSLVVLHASEMAAVFQYKMVLWTFFLREEACSPDSELLQDLPPIPYPTRPQVQKPLVAIGVDFKR